MDAEELKTAIDALAARDPEVARALSLIGYPAPRQRDPGFATLLRIITAQQLSTRSAAAVWRKLEAALGGVVLDAASFIALEDATLRACGFSGPKIAYARGLAAAILDSTLPLDSLGDLDEEAAISALTALRGFGRWSAEIYLLFALRRADIFPAEDLALQIGYQRLKRLPARPTGKALRTLVEPWRPQRGAGAIFLWHCYGAATLDQTADVTATA